MTVAQILLHSMIGVGLAASCGFRVFVPLLMASLATHAGYLSLAPGWEWVGSWPAIASLSLATAVEVAGFYIPWVDNLLDAAATPAAAVAGLLATAACVSEVHPALRWSMAAIAGGGLAAGVQSATVVLRGASTAVTGGAGNFLVATAELVASFVMSVLAILVPVAAVFLIVAFCGLALRFFLRRRRRRAVAPAPAQ